MGQNEKQDSSYTFLKYAHIDHSRHLEKFIPIVKLYLPLGLQWGGLGVPTQRGEEFLLFIFYNTLIFLKK